VKEYAGLEFVEKFYSRFVLNFNSTSAKIFSFTLMKFFCDIEIDLIRFFDGIQINSSDHIRIISPSYIRNLVYQNIY